MTFEFATPPRILFGPGMVRRAGELARELGRRALVVAGSRPERAQPLESALQAHGVDFETFSVATEPTIELVQRGVALAQAGHCEVVVGFGGGSALDTAKAIAALAPAGGDPQDYLEVVGRGRPLPARHLPVVAIPTTAGTGSEATRNAVLGVPAAGLKASLRGPTLMPKVALVDPELTYSVPPATTASTGLDTLTQLIEPFTSCRANPLTDALCRAGMARAARSLRQAWAHGRDPVAREDMALASLLGGMALANAGLGAVHGLAGPAGGTVAAPHGALCAALLPHVMAANIAALRAVRPHDPILSRYAEIARILTAKSDAPPEEGAAWVQALNAEMGIPSLGDHGFRREHFPSLIEKALASSSMKANPVALGPEQLADVLEHAMQEFR